MYIDLNFKGKDLDTNYKNALEAKKYGWNHINFSYSQNKFKEALTFKKELEIDGLTIDYTLEIQSTNPNEVRKISKKFRKKTNCITVLGGDLKVNRSVCENIQIDVLSRPYLNRFDSGLNHVLAKLAFDNNIAIELCFKDILNSYLSHRAKILSNWRDIYTLYRKFNFPLIISSRATSIFDIRSPRDIGTFLKLTGLNHEEVSKIMNYPKEILEYNKNRSNLIFKGVKVVSN